MKMHQKRVAQIIAEVSNAAKNRQRIKIDHGSSNSTRRPDFANHQKVDTSQLNHIVEINSKELYALVEPSVQMDELVEATLKYGLVPPVVMEFPGISVGGGIQGGAAESSSFKYGGFHESALEYEIMLGDGSVVAASRHVRPDLFWGTACSYGSLGILTLVKLRLVPAKPYVKLNYIRTSGTSEALQRIETAVHDQTVDFVDGILFTPTLGVIMVGKFTDKTKGPKETFTGRNDDWFYLHAQKIAKKFEVREEYIPLRDYIFRYDRGAFWMGRAAFAHVKLPFNALTRRLFDKAVHTRALYQIVHETDLSQQFFVQDIFMPARSIPSFIDYINFRTGIWPLWLLPMRNNHDKLDINSLSFTESDHLINVGVWGKPPTRTFKEFIALNRGVEDKLPGLHAHKTLYAHAYYPEDKFWQMYDKKHYDKLRDKYHAEGVFDNIYDKVTVTQKYKAPVAKAAWHYFVSKIHSRG